MHNNAISAINDVLLNTPHVFWCNYEHCITGILNVSDESALSIASRCINVLHATFHAEPNISIGDSVPTLQQIAYSHNRALTALSYRFYNRMQHIFSTDVICTTPPPLHNNVDTRPLMQAILKKDHPAIRAFCVHFIRNLMYVNMPPPNYVLGHCSALVSEVSQMLSTCGEEPLKPISNDVFACSSVQDTEEWLFRTFSLLSERFQPFYRDAHSSTTQNPLIRVAQDYIQQHIHENLLLEDIAQQVHLSPSYFASYYKKCTNINIRDYIVETKMNYAKQQLDQIGTTVTDIADALAYCDYRSFSRAFKKFYGMTPSEYRLNKGI